MEAWLQGVFADTSVLTVPWSIDYFSVIAGVLTGALFACDRKLDIIGTVVCGLITGYGGGVLRDTLMQGTGVYFTSHPDLIVTCILICAFVFYFRGIFKHLEATVFLADALSVGLFALAGASKAVAFEQGMVLSVIMGGITAVGGGAIRDICVGEVPGVFQRSNYYAVAGLGGAAVYVVLARFGCPLALAGIVRRSPRWRCAIGACSSTGAQLRGGSDAAHRPRSAPCGRCAVGGFPARRRFRAASTPCRRAHRPRREARRWGAKGGSGTDSGSLDGDWPPNMR